VHSPIGKNFKIQGIEIGNEPACRVSSGASRSRAAEPLSQIWVPGQSHQGRGECRLVVRRHYDSGFAIQDYV
jgi:hypothetical protein